MEIKVNAHEINEFSYLIGTDFFLPSATTHTQLELG